MVNHNVNSHLKKFIGLRGTTLELFRSFLTNRKISVCIGQNTSSTAPLSCGVHQGSILAPTIFMLYILPLPLIFRKYGISLHLYADDLQLYLSFKPHGDNALGDMYACIRELKIWLTKKCSDVK